ncbi:hypothetical protein [Mucilaginibacter sp. AK015]|jgi:hypothetical protein|uniref:hypothetical protein n=1 Tax=Mucilaginibacter sp. AK015 TaxID=2723072 RepID=UPI0012F89BAE|nr:hypothetical protein [Mucilaginibacter sp. AK015]MBB5395030.1 hypothetical protein [Mucilaginibacter sp. AK015]
MKAIAVFLTVCILLVSPMSRMANTLHTQVHASCYKKSAYKACGKHQKQASDNSCSKGTCNAMLSCSACGFRIIQSVSLSPAIIDLHDQTTRFFALGELSDYQDNDWNPPKV